MGAGEGEEPAGGELVPVGPGPDRPGLPVLLLVQGLDHDLELVYMDMDYGQLSIVWTIVHSSSWTCMDNRLSIMDNCPYGQLSIHGQLSIIYGQLSMI